MTSRTASKAQDRWLGPGELARAAGTSIKALRVYEKAGLLAPDRREGGWRVYGPEEVARVHQILALKALGLSIRDIGDILSRERMTVSGIMDLQARRLAAIIRTAREQLTRVQDAREQLAVAGDVPMDQLLVLSRDLSADFTIDADAVRQIVDRATSEDGEQEAVDALVRQPAAGDGTEGRIVELLQEAAIVAAEGGFSSPRAAALADRWIALAAPLELPALEADQAGALTDVAARLAGDPVLGRVLAFLRSAVQHRLDQSGRA